MNTPAGAQPRPSVRPPARPQRTAVHARGHAALAKTTVLIEALPWLSRFQGTTVVIKYGGNAMTEPALREAFAADVGFLRYAGIRVVVVHGGGPQITAHLDRLGITSRFAAGLRITDPDTMEVVRMVLVGQVNRDIVGLVNDHGPIAVGLSGEDANLFTARRRTAVVDGAEVDLGRVGEIIDVQPGTIHALLATGKVPVVASVARGIDGGVYNVNADTAAAALAEALGAAKLVVLTDVEGLYADWPDSEELISELAADELEQMMPSLASGMIPKMEACLRAVRGGVPQAHVLDGRVPHAVLLEVFTDDGIGTLITPAAGDPAAVAGSVGAVRATGSGVAGADAVGGVGAVSVGGTGQAAAGVVAAHAGVAVGRDIGSDSRDAGEGPRVGNGGGNGGGGGGRGGAAVGDSGQCVRIAGGVGVEGAGPAGADRAVRAVGGVGEGVGAGGPAIVGVAEAGADVGGVGGVGGVPVGDSGIGDLRAGGTGADGAQR